MRIHAEARAAHETYAINKALDAIWRVVADANRYFAGQEPWALKKTDPARMETVLYVTAEVLRIIGIMAQPYIPASAATLLDFLAFRADQRSFADLGTRLVSGTPLAGTRAHLPALRGGGGWPLPRPEHAGRRQPLPSRFRGAWRRQLPGVLARAEDGGRRAHGLDLLARADIRQSAPHRGGKPQCFLYGRNASS